MYDLVPLLRQHGVDVKVLPFYSPRAYEAIRSGLGPLGRAAWMGWGFARRCAHLVRAARADAVWIYRFPAPAATGVVVSALRAVRRPLVFGYDDAVYLNRGKASRLRSWAGSWRGIDRLIARSDCVLARNRWLGDYARARNPRVVVLPVAVDVARYDDVLSRASQPRREDGALAVAWIGTPSSAPYLAMVRSVLERLGREGPLELRLIGGDAPNIRGVTVKRIGWKESTEIEELCQADIGIAPLWDSEWTRGKSGLKVVQYMASGLPVVASAVGAYLDLLGSQQAGYLVRTEDEWLDALRELRDSKALRAKMGAAGRRAARLHHDFRVVAEAVAAVFTEVCRKGQDSNGGVRL